MRLHLVRHGQSRWNVDGRLQGQSPGIPLTELGEQQIRQTAVRLGGFGGTIWTSDLLRAKQSAEILADLTGGRLVVDERLREQCYGSLEGCLTRELVPEPVPNGFHITEIAWGDGESLAQVYLRVRSFLLDLQEADAVLVTHGDTLRVTLTVIDQLNRGEPDEKPHRLVGFPIVENGSLTSVEFKPSATKPLLRKQPAGAEPFLPPMD